MTLDREDLFSLCGDLAPHQTPPMIVPPSGLSLSFHLLTTNPSTLSWILACDRCLIQTLTFKSHKYFLLCVHMKTVSSCPLPVCFVHYETRSMKTCKPEIPHQFFYPERAQPPQRKMEGKHRIISSFIHFTIQTLKRGLCFYVRMSTVAGKAYVATPTVARCTFPKI